MDEQAAESVFDSDAVKIQKLRFECDLECYRRLRLYGMPSFDFWYEVALKQRGMKLDSAQAEGSEYE
jgi:hypothetical protein